MILATRHTGLVVRDLERSVAFYRDIFGLSVLKLMKESDRYIEQVVGIQGATLEWVKLKALDNSLIELIQYYTSPAVPKYTENFPSDRFGCSHIAFTVTDIDGLYKTLVDKGYHCNSMPQFSPDGKVKVMYGHDPDGIIIEFVQEVSQ